MAHRRDRLGETDDVSRKTLAIPTSSWLILKGRCSQTQHDFRQSRVVVVRTQQAPGDARAAKQLSKGDQC
jgi:hypothetical protein